jgi:hypothetical protein
VSFCREQPIAFILIPVGAQRVAATGFDIICRNK